MAPLTDDRGLLEVLTSVADAIAAALAEADDWGLAGTRPGQYTSDLAADAVAVDLLVGAGLGVLSEETGLHHPDRAVTVVVDPLDGSTNASHRLPWYATSLCAVDADGPVAAVVADLVHGTRFTAVRGGGAWRDGSPLAASGATRLDRSIVALNGLPDRHLGWGQFRAMGAAALDLCAVAEGRFDAFVDCTDDGLAPWDYLGGALVCAEAGATVVDLRGRPLAELDHGVRRTVAAGATHELAEAIRAARAVTPPAARPATPLG